MLSTYNDHGHVYFEQPLVLCARGSGCVFGSVTGTGAPTTRATVAKRATMMCLKNMVASSMLENALLQLECDLREIVEKRTGGCGGSIYNPTFIHSGDASFCVTGGGELRIPFFVLL